LQDHSCRCDVSNCHLETSHPGLRPSHGYSAALYRDLETRYFKIVNLPSATTGFIFWLESCHSIASNHQTPAYGELLARRRVHRTRGGRDPPFATIQQPRSLLPAAERKAPTKKRGSTFSTDDRV
jgi:hypothetical protein